MHTYIYICRTHVIYICLYTYAEIQKHSVVENIVQTDLYIYLHNKCNIHICIRVCIYAEIQKHKTVEKLFEQYDVSKTGYLSVEEIAKFLQVFFFFLFFATEPLIIGLFCGNWPLKIRQPINLRHPVFSVYSVFSVCCSIQFSVLQCFFSACQYFVSGFVLCCSVHCVAVVFVVCLYIYVYTYIYILMCVCKHTCIYVCIFMYFNVFMYICIYLYVMMIYQYTANCR